jgi:hypothetical protein
MSECGHADLRMVVDMERCEGCGEVFIGREAAACIDGLNSRALDEALSLLRKVECGTETMYPVCWETISREGGAFDFGEHSADCALAAFLARHPVKP